LLLQVRHIMGKNPGVLSLSPATLRARVKDFKQVRVAL
jgi:hypothetical protein